jgi:hypothetical protein
MRWIFWGAERRWLAELGAKYDAKIGATENCIHWIDKNRRGKVKRFAHIWRRWQNIKLPGVIGKERIATASFETWNGLTVNDVSDSTVCHINQYIHIIQASSGRESDAIFTDKIEIKAFFGILCLAGVIRSWKHSLEELWDIDGDGLVMNQIRLSDALFN